MEAEIVIPPDARNRYLERRKKDIDGLRSALATKTYDEFKRVGHQLKGNAASFGYGELEKIAVAIEAAGERQDPIEAARQLDSFQAWLGQTLLRQGS